MTMPIGRLGMLPAAALVVAALLGGCDDGSPEPRDTPAGSTSAPQPSAPESLSAATCRPYTHRDATLGVTVPAGFTVDTSEATLTQNRSMPRVNLLARIEHPDDTGGDPDVLLTVWGYGPGDREPRDGLVASVVVLTQLARGTQYGSEVPVTPTTIAGLPAETGGEENARVLDSADPDDVPGALRWWTVRNDAVTFVFAMAARTTQLGDRYAAEFADGTRAEGC